MNRAARWINEHPEVLVAAAGALVAWDLLYLIEAVRFWQSAHRDIQGAARAASEAMGG